MAPGGYIPPVLAVWSTPDTAICTANGRRDSAMATSAYPPAATRSWLTNWVRQFDHYAACHHASFRMCRQPIWGGHTGKPLRDYTVSIDQRAASTPDKPAKSGACIWELILNRNEHTALG